MIPSVIASLVRQGIEDFLETTFPISTPQFAGIVERLVKVDGSVFQGPYFSLKLPFRNGNSGMGYFPEIPMEFEAYLHQEQAFDRISAGHSTIVATGTGSGKTESFLYPILDYCRKHRGEPGIKCVLVYPMNALANDQAKRLARLIHSTPSLQGHVTAGMYIGQRDPNASLVMEPDRIMTSRDAMRLSPPDILITNYKMLDFLLIRPQDHALWKDNGSETLKYLVVDELHTFDGAQGTDLACLIRRVKARLNAPIGHLCCVATSATLGDVRQTEDLRSYARQIFDDDFPENAIITEHLLSETEFFADIPCDLAGYPDPDHPALDHRTSSSIEEYGRKNYALWFGDQSIDAEWKSELPALLKRSEFFRQIVFALQNRPRSLDHLCDVLDGTVAGFAFVSAEQKQRLLDSMFALVSLAREGKERKARLFLATRVQLWQRELTRLVASVGTRPELTFSDDLPAEALRRHLPIVHCRECGVMGWGAVLQNHQQSIDPDLQNFYAHYFAYNAATVFLFPAPSTQSHDTEEQTLALLCGECLNLIEVSHTGACAVCNGRGPLVPVHLVNPRIRDENGKGEARIRSSHDCPSCGSHEGLMIVGSRAASLTSVAIGQLFASPYNDHKKLLAFSDSVQDASHRAGFFGARTYRMTLRSAIQQCVEADEEPFHLSDLADRFRTFWQRSMTTEQFIATFLPPDLDWFDDYLYLVRYGTLPENSALLHDVSRRLRWEIVSEYTFNCRIGRTLEKTGSSVATVSQTMLDNMSESLLEVLRNCGGLRSLDQTTFIRFIHGILMQMKNKGGVDLPELKTFIEDFGNPWLIGRIPYMPRFGNRLRAPMFLTERRGTRFDTLESGGARNVTWYERWVVKCFGHLDPLIDASISEILRRVLNALATTGILLKHEAKSSAIWGLNPASLVVVKDVQHLRCGACGHQLSIAAIETDVWNGGPCLRFTCDGAYAVDPPREDYYRTLYSHGQVQRIIPQEHTGLLQRERRETIEQRFMTGAHASDPNLLSCTPTLEMGIDIGDLSSVFLCSVPPSQANYIQRIGRSGRTAGTAFNFTIATARPHDLYFHAQPEEMIAGTVTPPGCYLNAPAVLERQFTAYCFDRWLVHTGGKALVPQKLHQCLPSSSGMVKQSKFPHALLSFIDAHRTGLLSGFLELFGDALADDSITYLRAYVEGAGDASPRLEYKIISALTEVAKEIEDLRKRIKRLTSIVKEKEASPVRDGNFEQELADLNIEISSVTGIMDNLRQKDTLNFFTDEGLLPNYAFPEAGAILRSVIYRKNADENAKKKYQTTVYEYERPASSAIHEFAFENTFYAEGRRVVVDRVNMALSEIEEWQFCGECAYHERFRTDQEECCPRCGSEVWSDVSHRRKMLRIHQVEAFTSDRDSRSRDESDEREPRFYNRKKLVLFDNADITRAWKLEAASVPFGFEYLRKATFREINFGEKGKPGETVHIAGIDVLASAFTICRDCGLVQRDPGKPEHNITCRHTKSAKEAAIIDCVFLYREFTSEAIRMLLPSTATSGSTRVLNSFIAGLYLGLRRRFKGSIDHLQIMLDEDPPATEEFGKRYVLLYDTVPGGTGYIKELMTHPAAMIEVFQCAVDVLKSCDCRMDPDKDGCYRCIYSYRYSHDITDMSRDIALDLFGRIISGGGRIIEVDTIKNIPVNALLESELEALFIEALRRSRHDGISLRVKHDIVNGKPGWQVLAGPLVYLVEPQVCLGPEQGVAVPCEADFVFWPQGNPGKGRPVAIFTDGFAFHADAARNNLRVGKDMAQRMSVVLSDRFHVWSLTWDDVHARFAPVTDYYDNVLDSRGAVLQACLESLDAMFHLKRLSQAHEEDAFTLLIRFLFNPEAALWKGYAYAQAMSIRSHPASSGLVDELIHHLYASQSTSGHLAHDEVMEGNEQYGIVLSPHNHQPPLIALLSALRDQHDAGKLENTVVVCRLFDDAENNDKAQFKAAWNGFLRAYNVFQFLPNVTFITTAGLMDGGYDFLPEARARKVEAKKLEAQAVVSEMLSLAHPLVRPLILRIVDDALPHPVVGFELLEERGRVVATAELAWPKQKLVLLLPGEYEHSSRFADTGWKVVQIDDEHCIDVVVSNLKIHA